MYQMDVRTRVGFSPSFVCKNGCVGWTQPVAACRVLCVAGPAAFQDASEQRPEGLGLLDGTWARRCYLWPAWASKDATYGWHLPAMSRPDAPHFALPSSLAQILYSVIVFDDWLFGFDECLMGVM